MTWPSVRVDSLKRLTQSALEQEAQAWRRLVDGGDDEQPGHQDWETYLDRLFTLLLAYALGGVKALDNAPSAKEEDVLGADTTKFVFVPLDVVMRYHGDAQPKSTQPSTH